jgi:H/ACA ribonucleoprotein complex subunit 2
MVTPKSGKNKKLDEGADGEDFGKVLEELAKLAEKECKAANV